MRYKPDSGIGKMWTAYESGGAAAATAIGLSLGLASSTVKTRVDGWEREKRGGGPAPKEARIPRAPKVPYVPSSTKPRFIFGKKGKRELVIVHEGPEQSIARWMDTGEEQCVVNSWLVPVKTKHKEK